jgi:hypothetical protein
MAIAASNDAQWLRGAPRCRLEGSMVYITLILEPSRVSGPACLAWSAGGLHATTPRMSGPSVTCCVPRGVFDHGSLLRLQLLRYAEADSPVFAWTQIPVLEETVYRAEMVAGRPVLALLGSPAIRASLRTALAALD